MRMPVGVVVMGMAVVAIMAAAAWLPQHRDARATGPCETQNAAINQYELAVFHEINRVRTGEGLPALGLSPGLSRAAAWKSEDITAAPPHLSHTDSLGRAPGLRARDCGYPYGAGEIIAWGSFADAQHLVAEWMGSTGHRASILSPLYTVMGIGEWGNRTRWTVKFGQVVDSATPPSPATATPTASPLASPTPTPSPTMTPAPTRAGITVELSQGMNLAGYAGPSYPVDVALASAWDAVGWVYSWDVTAGRWQRYIPGTPGWVNTLERLSPGKAYFVGVTKDVDWDQ